MIEQQLPLKGKTIQFRFAEVTDAAFILSLRTDNTFNTYLSPVDNDLKKQQDWLRRYKEDEKAGKQFYFIIERLDGTPCGTVRIYDLLENSFCWGSWILNKAKSNTAALESAILIYRFGFYHLGLTRSHFDVMLDNQKVIKFHKRFGATEVSRDDTNIYFHYFCNDFEQKLEKYKRFVS